MTSMSFVHGGFSTALPIHTGIFGSYDRIPDDESRKRKFVHAKTYAVGDSRQTNDLKWLAVRDFGTL